MESKENNTEQCSWRVMIGVQKVQSLLIALPQCAKLLPCALPMRPASLLELSVRNQDKFIATKQNRMPRPTTRRLSRSWRIASSAFASVCRRASASLMDVVASTSSADKASLSHCQILSATACASSNFVFCFENVECTSSTSVLALMSASDKLLFMFSNDDFSSMRALSLSVRASRVVLALESFASSHATRSRACLTDSRSRATSVSRR